MNMKAKRIFIGGAALFLITIISIGVASCTNQFPRKASVGKTIQVDNILWKATSVEQKSEKAFTTTAHGKFIVVSLTAENIGSNAVKLVDEHQIFRIIDSKNQAYSPIQNDTILVQSRFGHLFPSIHPNKPQSGIVIFDVPKYSTNLKLEISDLSLRSNEKGVIDLGVPRIAEKPKARPTPVPAEKPKAQPTPPPAEKPKAAPAPQPPAKQWVTVAELSGNANKSSDVFELKGGQAKLTYNVSGSEMVVVSIYMLKEGHSLEKEGGFPEVMVTKPGSDTTFLTKDAGRYYLDVQGANADWSVKIEEQQ